MYLFISLIMLHVLSISLSHDLKFEGVLKLGDDLYKRIGNDHDKPQKLEIYARNFSENYSRSPIMRATSLTTNITEDLIKYIDHIKKEGARNLKDTGKQVISQLKLENSFIHHIDNVTHEYTRKIQNYSEYIGGNKAKCLIDQEFAFLDVVEKACKLIYHEQKNILNRGVMLTKHSNINDIVLQRSIDSSVIQKLKQNIFTRSIKTKREEMRYVCYKFEICRSYPALTDYIADFIVEIKRLPDNKLETFTKLMKILMEVNGDVFKKMSKDQDREEITKQLASVCSDDYGIHHALSVIRAVLTQRFKIIQNSDLKLKMKTNGVKIIIDIINKAFDYERDDLLSMEFDTTVKAIRGWVADERLFPESVITHLFNNIVKVLEYNLSKNAKKEIAVLIESIIRGNSSDKELYNSLFRNGSKYVRGEDFHSDIDII